MKERDFIHVAHRDPRLPPPSRDADDYTIALLGSEGSSFTPVKLSRIELATLLAIEDRINTHARGFGYQPELIVYYGGVKNIGTKDDPVWEPSGNRVQRPKIGRL